MTRRKKTYTVDFSDGMEVPTITSNIVSPPANSVIEDANAIFGEYVNSDGVSGLRDADVVENLHEMYPNVAQNQIDKITDNYVLDKYLAGSKDLINKQFGTTIFADDLEDPTRHPTLHSTLNFHNDENEVHSQPLKRQTDAQENADGSLTVVDINTGSRTTYVGTLNGGYVPSTTVSNGNVYAAGNVGVVQELNGLDLAAHEKHIKASISSATSPAPSSNGGTERRSSDGGNKGDGGGTKTGGNGTSKKHSVPSDTGYASKGVNNLEGLEAAGAGPISLYHRHGSGPDCRSWNT